LARGPACGVAGVGDRATARERRRLQPAVLLSLEPQEVRRAGRREALQAVGRVIGQLVLGAARERDLVADPAVVVAEAVLASLGRAQQRRPAEAVAVVLGPPVLGVDAGEQPVGGVVLIGPGVRTFVDLVRAPAGV